VLKNQSKSGYGGTSLQTQCSQEDAKFVSSLDYIGKTLSPKINKLIKLKIKKETKK
jgi:hypothetical protein